MTADVERYLTEVDRRLPGSRRIRTEVIDELRDGLLTAIDDEQPSHGRDSRVIAEFGDPTHLAATLGREIRLRIARRNAFQVVVLLLITAVGWQVYDTRIGTPDSMVPPAGWTRPVFIGGTVAIQITPILTQASALLLAIAMSLRTWHPYLAPLLRWLSATTLATTTAFGLSVITIMATVAPGYRAQTLAIGVPVACLSLLLLNGTYRAAHHIRHAS